MPKIYRRTKKDPLSRSLSTNEYQEHFELVRFCNIHRYHLQHIPNEGARNHLLDNSRGIWKGFPDFILWMDAGPWCQFFIELKKPLELCKRRADFPSLSQWLMIKWLNAHPQRIASVAFGASEAISFIERYSLLPKNSHESIESRDFKQSLHLVPTKDVMIELDYGGAAAEKKLFDQFSESME